MKNESVEKYSIVLILFIIMVTYSNAAITDQPVVIDTTFLKCEYKTNYYTDTIAMDNGTQMHDEFILQVGKRVSKYYSKRTDAYERMQSDPRKKEAYDKELSLLVDKAISNGGRLDKMPFARYGSLIIYNNYPANKRTIQDAIFLDYYKFEDDNLPQKWTIIVDSMQTILGYECKKAVCSYRGRNYEAWYSIDLAVNAGPWKFSGLPGLIMSVRDTAGHYTFEITGIENIKEPIDYIEYNTRKYTSTNRKAFLRMNAKASNIGWGKFLEANSSQNSESYHSSNGEGARYCFLEKDF